MLLKILEKCNLCPHECNVNRLNNELGRCRATDKVKVALSSLHYYEEPCISGKNGSGAIFFSGCNMSCKFCQNYKISQQMKGKEISIEELSNNFLELQKIGANNINLVTGFMYIPQIIEAIKLAKINGLYLPIIYNSSGYEKLESLKLLKGYIDVYLPDFKYYYNELGQELSGIPNYFEKAKEAIVEMYNQVGDPKFNESGLIEKGIIIRHLVLPNHIQNSKMILRWISKNLNKEIYVSVMAQYFPTNRAFETNDINRKLTKDEYNEIENYVLKLGIKRLFTRFRRK